jgi:hypothetical protein
MAVVGREASYVICIAAPMSCGARRDLALESAGSLFVVNYED